MRCKINSSSDEDDKDDEDAAQLLLGSSGYNKSTPSSKYKNRYLFGLSCVYLTASLFCNVTSSVNAFVSEAAPDMAQPGLVWLDIILQWSVLPLYYCSLTKDQGISCYAAKIISVRATFPIASTCLFQERNYNILFNSIAGPVLYKLLGVVAILALMLIDLYVLIKPGPKEENSDDQYSPRFTDLRHSHLGSP